MAHLRNAPPRPRLARVAPSYPRVGGLLAAASLALVVGCGGVVEATANPQAYGDAQPHGEGGHPDAGPLEASPPMPDPAGFAPSPYEDTGPLPGDHDGGTAGGGGSASDPAADAGAAPSPDPAADAGAAPSEGAK
jgi:hypothetical protein